MDIVSLSNVQSLISDGLLVEGGDGDKQPSESGNGVDKRRVRIVRPYPYTFATFAKARWVGRTVLDVYCSEFGK